MDEFSDDDYHLVFKRLKSNVFCGDAMYEVLQQETFMRCGGVSASNEGATHILMQKIDCSISSISFWLIIREILS